MLGRFIYSLIPIFLTAGALAMALVSFFASFRTNSAGLQNIYFMRLNLSNITVAGFDVSSLVTAAGIYPIYQVGASGYCYGTISSSNSVDIIDCVTPTVPFWFDLLGIFKESKAGNILDRIDLPDSISSYEDIIKAASSAVWVLLVVVCALTFIVFLLGIFSTLSKGLSVCILLISVLDTLCAIAAAAVATALFRIYRDKFNDTAETFGAEASLGATSMGLIWGMAAATLVATIMWSFTICCGSTTRKGKTSTQKYDPVDVHY